MLTSKKTSFYFLFVIKNYDYNKKNDRDDRQNIPYITRYKGTTNSTGALIDDFISDDEFKLIMDEMNKYKALKEEIKSNTKKKLKTEEEESLIERGRQEARESFRRLVEKNKTI